MSLEARLKKVLRTLDKALGPRRKGLKLPALETAIYAVLAPYNKDDQIRKAMNAMLKEFVDWNEVRVSSWKEIGTTLESSGIVEAGDKSFTLKKLLKEIFDRNNKMNMDTWLSSKVEETPRVLQSLADFPERASGAVLTLNLGYNALFVTPSLIRIAKRIGLIREGSLSRGRKALERRIPRKDHFRLQQHLSYLSDKVCLSSLALCNRCPLNVVCDSGIERMKKSQAAAKKATARKAAAKKATARKAAAKKATTRKATAKKATARKAAAKKATARKAAARKATTRKATAKKATARKATARKRSRKKPVPSRPKTKKTKSKKPGKKAPKAKGKKAKKKMGKKRS